MIPQCHSHVIINTLGVSFIKINIAYQCLVYNFRVLMVWIPSEKVHYATVPLQVETLGLFIVRVSAHLSLLILDCDDEEWSWWVIRFRSTKEQYTSLRSTTKKVLFAPQFACNLPSNNSSFHNILFLKNKINQSIKQTNKQSIHQSYISTIHTTISRCWDNHNLYPHQVRKRWPRLGNCKSRTP